MQESIHKIEATGEKRLKESFPGLHEEKKTSLLKKYHPDFVREGMGKLKVGVNKGDRTPH